MLFAPVQRSLVCSARWRSSIGRPARAAIWHLWWRKLQHAVQLYSALDAPFVAPKYSAAVGELDLRALVAPLFLFRMDERRRREEPRLLLSAYLGEFKCTTAPANLHLAAS
jgi:hypothetical protein